MLFLHELLQHQLKETLDALNTEKEKLMTELASSALGSSEAKKEVVDSVSNVLEDEFQCAICSELFINVSTNKLLLFNVYYRKMHPDVYLVQSHSGFGIYSTFFIMTKPRKNSRALRKDYIKFPFD